MGREIDWLIYGGESGPKFRPDSNFWAESAAARCMAYGAAFFHKQSSGLKPGMGSTGVHEFPKVRAN